MHALSLALVLAASPATGGAEPPGAVAPAPVSAPPAAASAAAPPAEAPPAAAAPAAAPPAAAPPPPLPVAAIEKMGLGDRSFLERDYRAALFAYQDAVYLAPKNPAPRLKLARAYLALRYPAQALAQVEQALAVDPGNPEATRLAEEARSPSAGRPGNTAPPASPAPPAPVPAGGAVRVFRFVPDPEPGAPAHAPASRAAQPAPAVREATSAPAPAPAVAPVAAGAHSSAASSPPAGVTAPQRYRAALEHLQNREFEKAVAALTDAITLDPRLAVAFAARASARFGLGRYREAAEDYRAAIALDPNLGTPLYGLAECYRVLGEQRNAADLYQRYADSRASDVREDLRVVAAKRAQELR